MSGELDQKYKDVAAALSVTPSRRTAEGTAETPDIQPRKETPRTDISELSDSEIADRTTDYKLGLRNDIA